MHGLKHRNRRRGHGVDARRDGHRANDDPAGAGALTGGVATAAVSAGPDAPNGFPGLLEGNPHQVLIQLYGVGVTVAYCAVVTSIILLVVAALTPLRVHPRSEIEGLDIAEHGESIHA
jgi:ammonium transporter, Amt family